jgi:hypothetical protein
VTIPLADYERLLVAAEMDDMIVWCETCGAWMDRDDEVCAPVQDFTGCWKAATHDSKYDHLCKSYRATVKEFQPGEGE